MHSSAHTASASVRPGPASTYGPFVTLDERSIDPTWQRLYEAIGTLVVAAGQLEHTVRTVVLNMLPGRDWRRTGLVFEGYSAS